MTMYRDIPDNVAQGDDVVVVLPTTGRQIEGRITLFYGKRADVWCDDDGMVRSYPLRWIYALEDAPEPSEGSPHD